MGGGTAVGVLIGRNQMGDVYTCMCGQAARFNSFMFAYSPPCATFADDKSSDIN